MEMSSLLEVPTGSSGMLLDRVVTTEPHRRMLFWGLGDAPHEACGLLIGHPTLTGHLVALKLRNIAQKPTTEWRIDTAWVRHHLFQSMTQAEFYDQVMVWHSHPGGTIGPSKMDLETMKIGVHYVVVTVPSGEVVRYERDN